ncbi:MAG TPA: hypothetical protein VF058_10790 [Actinomycetota bacterium]
MTQALVPAAILGPAAAALVWLALVRWVWPRRLVAGAVWIGSQAAAWAVFWEVFGGEQPAWMGLGPDLLRATLAAAAGAAVTLVLPRIELLAPRASSAGMAAAGVGLAAVVAAAYSSSLVALAVIALLPTIAVGLAGAVGDRPRGAPGLLGFAAADAAVVGGLLIVLERSGTTGLEPVGSLDLGVALVLLGAAVKLGAVPHVGTWRASAGEGIVSPLAVVLRGQGAVLAAVAAFTLARVSPSAPLAAVSAGLAVLAGLAGLAARSPGGSLAAVGGAGAAAALVALGLGGGVGARAALVLLPVFVLASGVVAASGWPGVGDPRDPRDPRERRRAWRWVAALALAIGAASLVGLPPAGGFPGTWLALSLASARAVSEPWHLALVVGLASGLALAGIGAIAALRSAGTRPLPAALSLLGGLALLYAGAQPMRLGLGWLIRVERELGIGEVLPSAGAPALPAIGGVDLAWAVAPALLIVGAGLVLPSPAPPRFARRAAGLARRLRLGRALAALLEGAAAAGAAWIVLRGVDLGFL